MHRDVGTLQELDELTGGGAADVGAGPKGSESEELGRCHVLAHDVVELSTFEVTKHDVIATARLYHDQSTTFATRTDQASGLAHSAESGAAR